MTLTELMMIAGALAAASAVIPNTRRANRRRRPHRNGRTRSAGISKSSTVRPDDVVLSSRLEDLNYKEFEHLLALYFRDNGYDVEEIGGAGDGGVDLVITEKRTGERTAVQAKHWANQMVGPDVVRELYAARANTKPACHFGWIITSSDLTSQAREEADRRLIKYTHGSALEHMLKQWGKWTPAKKPRKVQVAREKAPTCRCGAPMVKRQDKKGTPFWGCSTFPKCRHTRPY